MSTISLLRFGAALFLTVGAGSLSTAYGQAATQRGVQEAKPPTAAAASSTSAPKPIGPYYALVIGNNNYKELNKLQTAIDDANAVAKLLQDHFGFQANVLKDATRAAILDALDDYQRTLPEKSNLLIYYAGHGHKDEAAHRAYWLPVDAQISHSPNWINAVEITDKLRAIPSRHILVIADSCWSGDLTERSGGASITSLEHNVMLAKILTLKSRHIMSSGGDEPVADGGGDGHSVFTGALLKSLNDMEGDNFTAESLLVQRIKPRVAGRSQQTPEYLIVRESDSDLGDFVFFRKRGAGGTTLSTQIDLPAKENLVTDEAGRASLNTFSGETLDSPANSTSSKPGPSEGALLAAIGKVVDNWAKDSQTARFKISGPPEAETVLDTQTGLMWTRIDYWSLEKAFAANWNDAMNWGKKLNAAGYGGYSDWAVPTIRQYKTMNASKEDRDLYLQVFRKTDATNFWSSETPDQRLARYISFTDGATIPGAKTDPGWAKRLGLAAFPISVRLVRVAQPASTDRQTGPRNPPPLLEQRRNARKAVLNRAKD